MAANKSIEKKIIREPDEYREPISDRKNRKWDKIISLFMENRLEELALHHRTGARGRILSHLSINIFNILQMPFRVEPIFSHIKPAQWYIKFAKDHEIPIRTHTFYNPDLFLEDGTWVEITLSENAAYKKLFRYGHQADKLQIYWLDNHDRFYKEICQNVEFPNARIDSIECFNTQLKKLSGGIEIIERLKILKNLKGTIL